MFSFVALNELWHIYIYIYYICSERNSRVDQYSVRSRNDQKVSSVWWQSTMVSSYKKPFDQPPNQVAGGLAERSWSPCYPGQLAGRCPFPRNSTPFGGNILLQLLHVLYVYDKSGSRSLSNEPTTMKDQAPPICVRPIRGTIADSLSISPSHLPRLKFPDGDLHGRPERNFFTLHMTR